MQFFSVCVVVCGIIVYLRLFFSWLESILRENWNVLRLLNREKGARIPTETYKSTVLDTTGRISHIGHRLFTRTTQRIQGSDWVGHPSFHSIFPRLLWTLFYLQLFIFSAINLKSLPATFLPTHISVILPMSFIIIFSPCLSWLLSSPPFLPVSPHNFSTTVSFNPLHFTHQNFSFSCHHLSVAAGEVCV